MPVRERARSRSGAVDMRCEVAATRYGSGFVDITLGVIDGDFGVRRRDLVHHRLRNRSVVQQPAA